MSDEPEEADRMPGAPHPRHAPRLFGQEDAEARFLAATTTGRLHHAWLIVGPRGVGKATLAWRIARHLVAGAGGGLGMAPDHPVFRQTAQLAHPSIALCRRPWDEKARRLKTAITVDEIRGLRSFFQMSATDGGWRVAIIDAADEMTRAAANALLKLLEEPPPRAAIVLVCHQPSLLLPTIRSRCRDLRCLPLGADHLAAALAQAGAEVPADPARLEALSGGSVGRAFALIESDGLALYDDILALLATAPPVDRPAALALAEACGGRDGPARFELTLGLLEIALSRLARAGATGGSESISAAEARLVERLAPGPSAARVWAALVFELRARATQARAVNLDPAGVILDTLLRIDAAATDARARAA